MVAPYDFDLADKSNKQGSSFVKIFNIFLRNNDKRLCQKIIIFTKLVLLMRLFLHYKSGQFYHPDIC